MGGGEKKLRAPTKKKKRSTSIPLGQPKSSEKSVSKEGTGGSGHRTTENSITNSEGGWKNTYQSVARKLVGYLLHPNESSVDRAQGKIGSVTGSRMAKSSRIAP